MKTIRKIIIIVLAFTFISAGTSVRKDYRLGRNNNVCKNLKSDVLLYFVFIDTRTTLPWTEFDILTTIDSIHVAEQWIEAEAKKANINLNIKTDYYIGSEFTTINKNLPKKTITECITDPNYKKGVYSLNKWADMVSKIIGESVYIKERDGIPTQKKPNTKERLLAHLRDDYGVESVALMFFVNNYFRNDISIAINTNNTEDVEFSIVSYKYPSEIAHNFMKLFGGVDMYKSYERRSPRRIRIADEYFPNDIMQDPYGKGLENLEIGEFTKYMIGWTDELNPKYDVLLTDGPL